MLRFELHIVASQLISFEKRFGALCFASPFRGKSSSSGWELMNLFCL
jgi:hypothetical protein